MLEFGQHSPYQTFAALHHRLLHRPADYGAVSLLGQAVSDVLDSGCPDEEVQKVIADLEAARATGKEGDAWGRGHGGYGIRLKFRDEESRTSAGSGTRNSR